jgi:hypothetical protein
VPSPNGSSVATKLTEASIDSKLKKAASTSGPAEAACCRVVELFLLLALVVSLRRMLVSYFGFLNGLSWLLLGAHMVAAAMLLRRSPMSFRSLLVMFGSLLMHILRHGVSFCYLGDDQRNKWSSR